MSDFEPQQVISNEFKSTQWLAKTIQELESLKPNERKEFFLSPDIHFLFFVAELGRTSRAYEIGGVYNHKTRSIIATRGQTSYKSDLFGIDGVFLPVPRVNPDGTCDDAYFHTHTNRLNVPSALACMPSNSGSEGDDLSVALNISLIEKWDHYRRTFISVIGYGGYISVTESTGMEIDDDKLLAAGVTKEKIIEVKRQLGLYPSYGLENSALATKNGQALFLRIKDFYEYCDKNMTVGYIAKYRNFEAELKNKADEYGLSEKDLDYLIKYLREQEQERRFVGTTFLMNKGYTEEQAALIQSMYGLKTTVYKVDEEGMTQIDFNKQM